MSSQLILTGREIVCPTTNAPMVIDLLKLARAETRLAEVAFVTPMKAPELLSVYNETWSDLNDLIVRLKAELVLAESAQASIRACILLDEAAGILKNKGLSSSADLREAVLDSNPRYVEARDRCRQIECVVELFKGKQKVFENAFTSVKKIMGEDAYTGGGASRPNPYLSGDTGTAPVGGTNVRQDLPSPGTTPAGLSQYFGE